MSCQHQGDSSAREVLGFEGGKTSALSAPWQLWCRPVTQAHSSNKIKQAYALKTIHFGGVHSVNIQLSISAQVTISGHHEIELHVGLHAERGTCLRFSLSPSLSPSSLSLSPELWPMHTLSLLKRKSLWLKTVQFFYRTNYFSFHLCLFFLNIISPKFIIVWYLMPIVFFLICLFLIFSFYFKLCCLAHSWQQLLQLY